MSRSDVITIRFRADEQGGVTKVVPDHDLEFAFDEPYVVDRAQVLESLQQSVVPVSYDRDLQAGVGQKLTNALLSGRGDGGEHQIIRLYQEAMATTTGPVTFQLAFDEGAFRPAQLPWELMSDGSGHVVADERIRLNRYITYFGDREPFEEVDPLRVLYLESRPKDSGKLPDITGAYRDAVARLGDRVQTELVRHATFDDLESALSSGEFHVVHYDGHGAFDGTSGYLLFEDGDRQTDWVDSARFSGCVGDSDVRLVVLGACQGSTVGGMGMFQSTAPALIRAGVPAVTANQFAVYVDAQEAFTHEFYASIVRGESISAAVADGRRAMAPHRGQFFLPTLYLRIADGEGYLFGGEPETHRRWRMSEMQKLAVWWYGLSAIQQAMYMEGLLRWQGQVIEPVSPIPRGSESTSVSPAEPEPLPPVHVDEPRDGGTDAAAIRLPESQQDPTTSELGDVSGVYELLGAWRPPFEYTFGRLDGSRYTRMIGMARRLRVDEKPTVSLGREVPSGPYVRATGRSVEIEAITEPHSLGFRFVGDHVESTHPPDFDEVVRRAVAATRQFNGEYDSEFTELVNNPRTASAGVTFTRALRVDGREVRPSGPGGYAYSWWDEAVAAARETYANWSERFQGVELCVPTPLDPEPVGILVTTMADLGVGWAKAVGHQTAIELGFEGMARGVVIAFVRIAP